MQTGEQNEYIQVFLCFKRSLHMIHITDDMMDITPYGLEKAVCKNIIRSVARAEPVYISTAI